MFQCELVPYPLSLFTEAGIRKAKNFFFHQMAKKTEKVKGIVDYYVKKT